jgi:hypothetical protein
MCGRYALYAPTLALAVIVGGCISTGVSSSTATKVDRTTPFLDALYELGGPTSRLCGEVKLHDDPSIPLTCAKAALSSGAPFRLALQEQGVDSILWVGIARGANGATWLVTFDSDIHGGGASNPHAEPRLTRTLCLDVQLGLVTEPNLSCRAAGSGSERLPLRPTKR